MSQPAERAAREAQIWDGQTLQRDRYDAALDFANHGPPRHRRIRFIGEAVADLGDKTVLEIGSQAWEWMLRRYGVKPRALTCINISQTELDLGKAQAAALDYPAAFQVADAHKLPFPDATFDFVYGVAILHHLDFPVALAEIARVTKPGGRILFVEPLRLNPVAQLVRLLTPKARTPDELPLAREELRIIEKYFEPEYLFTDMFHLPVALLSQFLFKDPVNPLTRAGDAVDRAVVSAFPGLGVFYRTITILGRKRA
jgi:SAM-dependent methyltransferase